MGRVAKPRPLSFHVDVDGNGTPFISGIEFCSADMSQAWGQSFAGILDLNDSSEPYVAVYIADRYSNLIRINKSPFTGGEIVTTVNSKVYDEIVSALLASRVPEGPPPADEEPPVAEEEDFEEVEEDDEFTTDVEGNPLDPDVEEEYEDDEDVEELEDDEDADYVDEDEE